MSTYIELDSKYRDRELYSNPADYIVSANQTSGWNSLIRTTQCVKPCSKKEACNLLFSIKLLRLLIPTRLIDEDGETLEFIARDPYNQPISTNNNSLFVRLTSQGKEDKNLINSINNENSDATFSVKPVKTFIGNLQYNYSPAPNENEIDINSVSRGSIEWTEYSTHMVQSIRFEPEKPVIVFRIFTNQSQVYDGNFVPLISKNPGFNQRSNSVRIYDDSLISSDKPNPTRQTRCLFELTPYVRDGDYSNHVVSLYGSN